MHRTLHRHCGSRARRTPVALTFAAVVAALSSVACVTQEKYDETQLAAKHWQKQNLDQEQYIAQLEAENAKLKRQLEASEISVVSAGGDLDERMRSLKNLIAELGANPGDVTKFRVEGGYVYQVKEAVLFPLGSADVSTDGQRILLETIAPDINSKPHGRVFVRGHTDNVPVSKPETMQKFPHGNLQLSAARAVEVAAVLMEKGKVLKERMVVMGFGPSEPVAQNNSDANRQKNRRVEIFVADEPAPSAKPSEASAQDASAKN